MLSVERWEKEFRKLTWSNENNAVFLQGFDKTIVLRKESISWMNSLSSSLQFIKSFNTTMSVSRNETSWTNGEWSVGNLFYSLNNFINPQIAFNGGSRSLVYKDKNQSLWRRERENKKWSRYNENSFISHSNMHRIAIRFWINSNCFDSQLSTSANNTTSDLSTICD
jgi:hypothetical protein